MGTFTPRVSRSPDPGEVQGTQDTTTLTVTNQLMMRSGFWTNDNLVQEFTIWTSRVTTTTSLIDKNEWDICDRIYRMESFIIVRVTHRTTFHFHVMEGLHHWKVVCSSLHRLCGFTGKFRWYFVLWRVTLQNRRISSHGSSLLHVQHLHQRGSTWMSSMISWRTVILSSVLSLKLNVLIMSS